MSLADFAVSLFQAIAAIPGIAGFLQDFIAAAQTWYISRANDATKQALVDAAAASARAVSPEDREKALALWRAALAHPRITRQ